MARRLVAFMTTFALTTLAMGALFARPTSLGLQADERTPQTGRGGGAGVIGAAAGATTPPGQPAAPVDGTGALSGVVVDLVTGKPIAGAQVQLSGARNPSSRQLTDEKGRFIFTKLPAGDNYFLRASRIGYDDSPIGARLVLSDGQWISDARIPLARLGSIGGRITDENGDPVVGIFVRVLAQVLVSGLPQLAAGPAVKTDDRGVYRIAGLTPGKYLVHVPSVQWSAPTGTSDATLSGISAEARAQMEAAGRPVPPRHDQTLSPDGKNILFLGGGALPPVVSPTGGQTMAYPMMFYPSARNVSEALTIDLGRGEDRSDIDVQVRPVATVRVSGIIEAAAGTTATGMTARLVPAGLAGLGNGAEAATALVGPEGTFTFLSVPPGTYTFTAGESLMEFQTGRGISGQGLLPSPPGWRSSSGGGGQVASGPAGTQYNYRNPSDTNGYSARSTIAVGASDLPGVVVPLRSAITISGWVVYESAPTAAPGAPPVPQRPLGGPVYADPANGDASLGMPSGRVDQDGADMPFSIEGVRPGQYVLRFLGLGSPGLIKSIVAGDKDYTSKPLDVSGRDLTDLLVTFTSNVAKIAGSVKDGRGQPLNSGNVILFPAERDQWSGYGLTPTRLLSTSISNDGSYRYPTVRAGSYFLIAVDASLATAWQDPRFLEAAAGLATRILVDWGDSKTVDLSAQQVPGYRAPGSRP